MEIPKMLTKTDIKQRGWNDLLINSLLGKPDKTKRNPHYRSATPMSLYLEERVNEAEKTEDFINHIANRESRVAAAQKAVATKTSNIIDYVNNLEISIPYIIPDLLTKKACRHYEELWAERGESRSAVGGDIVFINRITVNYLRHECSNYEYELAAIYKKTGKGKAYDLLKSRILDAIAEKYPELKAECINQY